jgi:hypothetical protein
MGSLVPSRGQARLLGQEWAPNPIHTLNGERGNPDRLLETGRVIVISNDGLPGIGG